MRRVAKGDGDRVPVEVVDADDAHRRVDGVVEHLAQHIAPVARLPSVDPDRALAPPCPDSRRPKMAVCLHRSLDEPTPQVALVTRPERHVLGRVGHGHELGQRGRAVDVAEVEEHVGDGRAERLRDAGSQPSGLPHAGDAEIDSDQRDLRVAVAEHQHGGCQIALDRLDRGAEESQSGHAGAELRIDRAPGGSGVQRRSHLVSSKRRREGRRATPLPVRADLQAATTPATPLGSRC